MADGQVIDIYICLVTFPWADYKKRGVRITRKGKAPEVPFAYWRYLTSFVSGFQAETGNHLKFLCRARTT